MVLKELFADFQFRSITIKSAIGQKETCRAVPTKGGPFSADEPAWETESLAPESAYWRTYARVKPGHSYLVGTWVKYANAKILLWNYGTQVDGKPSNQRL